MSEPIAASVMASLLPHAKVLVIRKDNIGDLVCTTPMIRALRQHFPHIHLAALVNSYNGPVLRGNPDLDAVHVYTKAKHRQADESLLGVYWRRLALMGRLRWLDYDLAILANCSFVASSLGLARQMGPKRILGFSNGSNPRLEARLTDPVPYHPDPQEHEVERLAKLLVPLGIPEPMPAARVYADEALLLRQRERLNEAWGSFPRPPIAIHISARKVPQRWPAERFVALMRALYQERGERFMLFWSPGEENNPLHPGDDGKAREILAALSDVPVQPCPTARLEELIAGLACCGAMVCSDGGAMHLGAGLGLPIVCFFGNSDARKWHPWGVPYELLQADSQDVNDISVAQALEAYSRLQGRLA
ncbi:glycosyltransferase family 9 protein [Azospira inquinata]|uniref:Glycosyltransferase family 9 protein n=1 Tax=Azospira inquinata TaxID=2785627 RepID=A0A975SKE5_9RHOO|nr:glycosyltransferase family 9 protein [Azospira inquinata]QWT46755.1 glycosyltransferase family 9 protein [Azospira inquinata]QWT47922.1 glycosyltransferase family 9 protein [Azospira inquinata]